MSTARPSLRRPPRRPPPPPEGWLERLVARFAAPIDPLAALRVSNIVSFIILFILGYRWGLYTSANPWKIGALLVLAGVLLTAIAIPLGGWGLVLFT